MTTPPSQDELRDIIEVVYNRGVDKGINLDANDGDVIIDNAVNKIRTNPPTLNGVVSDEMREQVLGCIAPHMTPKSDNGAKWAVDNLMLLITQQTTAARIDELEHTQHDFTHGESSAAFDDGRTYEQLLNKQRLTELKKGLK